MILAATIACVAAAAGGDTRPVLAAEQTRPTEDGRFLIHFTEQGDDATTDTAIDWIESGLAITWQAFVDDDGWAPPPGDEGAGGDDRIDVYVRTIEGNGFAHVDPTGSGVASCWIELDPGMAGLGMPTFQSIAGHELHHCLQFVQTTALDSWVYEATSTYAQYLLFAAGDDQALDLARETLWRLRLTGSERPIDAVDGRFEYAGLVWAKFLVDRAGDRRALLQRWQEMALAGTWAIPSFADEAAELAIWQWFACDRDDGRWLPDGAACELDSDVRPDAATAPGTGTSDPIGRHGSAYVRIQPDCTTADLHIEVTPAAPMRVQVIGADVVEGTTVEVADWNHLKEVAIVGTALDGSAGTFAWSVTATGTYEPPATLPPLESIALDPAGPVTLAVGDRVPLSASSVFGTCSDGAPIPIEWSIADTTIADLDAADLVALAPGTTTVTARSGDITATLTVSVTGEDPGGCGCSSSAGGDPILLAILVMALLRLTPSSGQGEIRPNARVARPLRPRHRRPPPRDPSSGGRAPSTYLSPRR